MSPEELKSLSWQFDDNVFNHGNFDVIEEIVDPGFVNHDPLPGQSGDRDGIAPAATTLRAAFPDVQFINDGIIAEGNIVAHRVRIVGTHQGEYLGVAPTGKQITIKSADFIRFQNAKMIEMV